jgi:hypothetical protein
LENFKNLPFISNWPLEFFSSPLKTLIDPLFLWIADSVDTSQLAVSACRPPLDTSALTNQNLFSLSQMAFVISYWLLCPVSRSGGNSFRCKRIPAIVTLSAFFFNGKWRILPVLASKMAVPSAVLLHLDEKCRH